MGRAIVRDAKVFLMDEPLSSLDAKLRVSGAGRNRKIHRKTTTICVTTTRPKPWQLTTSLSCQLLKWSRTGTIGRIEQIGTPQELYNEPANEIWPAVINKSSHNFFSELRAVSFRWTRLCLLDFQTVSAKSREKAYQGRKWYWAFGQRISTELLKRDYSFWTFGSDSILCVSRSSGIFCTCCCSYYHKAGRKINLVFNVAKAHFFSSRIK